MRGTNPLLKDLDKLVFERGQSGNITIDNLSSKERNIVERVVNRDNPEDFNALMTDLEGRSIFYSLIGSEFGGIQIIGAGGNIAGSADFSSSSSRVYNVQGENYKHKLPASMYTRNGLTEYGELLVLQSDYVPLHGLTRERADIRRSMLNKLQGINELDDIKVPSLLAEGQLNQLDIYGIKLVFQVYSHPNKHRVVPSDDNNENVAYNFGRGIRKIHERGIAHMGTHPGNLVDLEDVVYLADWDTAKDVSKHKHGLKFFGLDLFMFMECMQDVGHDVINPTLEGYFGYVPNGVGDLRSIYGFMSRFENEFLTNYQMSAIQLPVSKPILD